MKPTSGPSIDIANRQRAVAIPRALVRRAARAALAGAPAPARVAIAFAGDDEIAEVNERFLGHSGPTDVISFRYSAEGAPLEGELVVNPSQALREAEARGHSVEAELVLYVVHGLLHLTGYDDLTRRQRERMNARQLELLRSLGIRLADHARGRRPIGGP